LNNKEPIFYWHGKDPELNIKWAHNIVSMRYTGWFTNEDGSTYKDGSGLCRGFVLTLPKMPGFPHGRFIAGYHWGDNDEYCLYPDIFQDIEKAARKADWHSERFSEMAREDNSRWNKARDLENDTEDAIKRLRECLVLRNKKCLSYVREEISEILETIRSNRDRLQNEFADYC
jgi:hypothetical protein